MNEGQQAKCDQIWKRHPSLHRAVVAEGYALCADKNSAATRSYSNEITMPVLYESEELARCYLEPNQHLRRYRITIEDLGAVEKKEE